MSCPRCRRDTPRGASFCPSCGAALGAGDPSPRPKSVEPILGAIAKTAALLCDARDALIFLVEGSTLRLVAHHGAVRTTRTLGTPFPLSPGTIHGRAVLERRVIHIRDLKAATRAQYPDLVSRQRTTGVRTMLAAPLLSEGAAIGVITIRRPRVRPFSAKQIALLRTFADQAALAIEKAQLSEEREARNRDLTEALEQRTATAEILRVISSSPTDLQPVFETIVRSACRLCNGTTAAVFLVRDGTIHHPANYGGSPEALAAARARYPRPLGMDTGPGVAILTRSVYEVRDVEDSSTAEHIRAVGRVLGFRSVITVPMLREGEAIGAIAVTRREPGPFSEADMALLQTFADQAVIAIENVRLFKELEARNRDLTDTLEQQTATSEILRVISNSPTNLQPVMEVVAENAARVCGATNALVFRLEDGALQLVASYGDIPYAFPPLDRGSATGRAIVDRETVHVHDMLAVEAEFPWSGATARRRGARTYLATPLLREGVPIGVISIRRLELRPFSDRQIELLKTFADQAVIAIENVRLFKELEARNRDLTEALDQQTATSEILRVISSSPTSVEAVFDTILANVLRLCETPTGGVFTFDGQAFHLAAAAHWSGEFLAALQAAVILPGPETPLRRVGLSREVSHVADIFADPSFSPPEAYRLEGMRTSLAVPMLKEGRLIGALTFHRREVRPFSEQQIALIKTFADQAVIAIENVRLFKELEARNRDLTETLEQQTATAEILRVISTSPTNLQPVLDTVVASAARFCGADDVILFQVEGDNLRFPAHYGPIPGPAGSSIPLVRGSVAGRTVLERRVVHLADVQAETEEFPDTAARAEAEGHRTTLGVPLLREGAAIGALVLRRTEADPFTDKQIKLLQTFADQAVIAIENVRLFTELQEKNEALTRAHAQVSEALDRQTATSEILRVISQSPIDVQPVFDTVVENAMRLCDAVFGRVFRRDGDTVLLVANANFPDELGHHPAPLNENTLAGRVIITGRLHLSVDVESDPAIPKLARETYRQRGVRSILSVPMLREGEAIGAIAVGHRDVGVFGDTQVALLQTFADQAVIAIENVRLFKELAARNRDLTQSLDQQTATSEILRVISSSPTDVQPVFDTILDSATRLCAAENGILYQYHDEAFHTVACRGLSPEAETAFREQPARPRPHSGLGRMLAEKRPVHVADVTDDVAFRQGDPLRARTVTLLGARTAMWLPLLKNDAVVGALAIFRRDIRPFTATQIDLVGTFADQAVIAIENVRLFKELEARNRDLTNALEQQTATSDVLRIIAQSPTELQPVLDAIATSAVRLCAASDVVIERLEDDHFYNAAHAGTQMKGLVGLPLPLTRRFPGGRAVLDRRPIIIDDIMLVAESEYPDTLELLKLNTVHSCAEIPLLSEGKSLGNLAVLRAEVRPFTDAEVALLQTFADQAVIAIENVRLFKELQARTTELTQSVDQLTALGELSRAVSSTLDVETVLQTVVSRARDLAGADGCLIYEYDAATEHFHVRATDNLDAEFVEAMRRTPIRKGEGVSGRAAEIGQPVQVADITQPGIYASSVRDLVIRSGYRAVLSVPLLREDEVIGSLILIRKTPGEFSAEIIEALKTFATQSALAIQNARLFHEIEDKGRQLEIASKHKSQFLANMSHELRTPLNAILGYTELLLDGVYGEVSEKARETMARIDRSGRHLLALINDVLDLSKIEAGQLTLSLVDYSLTEVIHTVVTAMEPLAAEKGLALRVVLDPALPLARGDDRRISQVLLNLVGNAVKFTDTGEVRIEARATDGAFLVSVSDTGPGIATEDQGRIFEEFQQADASNTRKKGGTGLGLSIAKRILALHGGRIWVESTPGMGSTFFFTLPVRVERMAEAS